MCLGWDGEGEILTPTCPGFTGASSPLKGEEERGGFWMAPPPPLLPTGGEAASPLEGEAEEEKILGGHPHLSQLAL